MSIERIVEKTRDYLQVPSVVLFEKPFIQHLAADFRAAGCNVEEYDRLLVVRRAGLSSPKILTAHIDRHGMVVNDTGAIEYAQFYANKKLGEPPAQGEAFFKKLGERPVGESVYAYNPDTGEKLAEGQVTAFAVDHPNKNLYFDVSGLSGLPTGTPISYLSPLLVEGGRISSQIDNAISVAVARQLVEDGFDGTLLLPAGEEIEKSWKQIADYLTQRDIQSHEIVTIDTTPYEENNPLDEGLLALRNEDQHGVFNPDLVARLQKRCRQLGIKYDMKDEVIRAKNAALPADKKPAKLGTTELGRVVEETKGRLNGATVQLPTTSYHTNHEMTSLRALENYYLALKGILNS